MRKDIYLGLLCAIIVSQPLCAIQNGVSSTAIIAETDIDAKTIDKKLDEDDKKEDKKEDSEYQFSEEKCSKDADDDIAEK